MRKLLWFTLGFGAACAFCAYGRLPLLLAFPASVLLLAVFVGNQRHAQILLAVLGIAAGSIWFSRFEASTLAPIYTMDGITQRIQIRCSSFPEETDYGCRAEGRIQIGEKTYAVMCYLDQSENVVPGTILSGPFRLRITAPGGMKESTYYQGDGIFLLAYQADDLTIRDGEVSWQDYPAKLRQNMLNLLEKALPADVSMQWNVMFT